MLTVNHGGIIALPDEQTPPEVNPLETLGTSPFDYMFPELQDDPGNNLLPESGTTVEGLKDLGNVAMKDPGEVKIPGVRVPTIHTFLGQFIDHDITLMDDRGAQSLGNPTPLSLENPTPLSPDQIAKIVNARSPNLDLDNVYGPDLEGQPSPRDSDKMLIGKVVHEAGTSGLPPGKDEWNDLPRLENGIARIGDPRNDENLIIAQLHVAFLRAHNAIVDEYHVGFEDAKKLLIQHYQLIVLENFLEQICDPDIVKRIKDEGPKFFPPSDKPFFMPLEFSIAAYRFGHSKVRPSYMFNDIHSGQLDELFSFTHRRLPDDWVIQWPSFVDPKEDKDRFPRPIDTSLASKLLNLSDQQLGGHDPQKKNLAVRNLLRGYMLKMPTGQAVASAMASQGITPLTPDQILSVANRIPVLMPVAGHQTQADTLQKNDAVFLKKTPLWFYILAEAAFFSGGYHLGPVGSTIVAEVLIGVLRNSTYSILTDPDWKGPTLKGDTPGKFDIEDLLKLAGVF